MLISCILSIWGLFFFFIRNLFDVNFWKGAPVLLCSILDGSTSLYFLSEVLNMVIWPVSFMFFMLKGRSLAFFVFCHPCSHYSLWYWDKTVWSGVVRTLCPLEGGVVLLRSSCGCGPRLLLSAGHQNVPLVVWEHQCSQPPSKGAAAERPGVSGGCASVPLLQWRASVWVLEVLPWFPAKQSSVERSLNMVYACPD